MKQCYLFVYGTLRKDFDSPILEKISRNVEWLGGAVIRGKLFDIGKYPGAVPLNEGENGDIKGELIRINDEETVMKILDEYEGFDRRNANSSEYIRKKESVVLENRETLLAWVYWYNWSVEGKARITNNDYLNYLKNRSRESEI